MWEPVPRSGRWSAAAAPASPVGREPTYTAASMRRRDRYLVIVLTLLAAAFRFPTLSVQSFWFDEAATVRLLRLGFGSMIHEVATQESTPPLFYTLGWVWVRVFGESEAVVRSMSALLGTLTVPAAYLAARTLASSRAALACPRVSPMT